MKKIISFVGMFAVMGAVFGDAHGVAMSANIRRLLQEKQDKIAKLEECEGKKQGWMIAGISTIGLTAVGVGVNIAQASKSNRLSDEIEMEKTTLQRQQDELDRISNQIAEERAKKAEKKEEPKSVEKPKEEKNQEPAEKKEESKEITLDAAVNGKYFGYNSIDDILVEEPGLWTVGFLDYTVHGTAVCNNNTGMHAKASNSEQTEAGGTECWCKMTNPKQSRWVFLNSYIDASSCIGDGGCAGGCANRVADDADFRGAVFGSVK